MLSVAASTLSLVASMAHAGCYSWQLGTSPVDGGEKPDAARLDAHLVDAQASGDSDTAPPKGDAMHAMDAFVVTPDGTTVDASSCSALEADVVAKRTAAIACVTPAEACIATVTDACGCEVFVGMPAGAGGATASYVAAVAALKGSGCPLGCTTACVTVPGSLCLTNSTGSGMTVTACSQATSPP